MSDLLIFINKYRPILILPIFIIFLFAGAFINTSSAKADSILTCSSDRSSLNLTDPTSMDITLNNISPNDYHNVFFNKLDINHISVSYDNPIPDTYGLIFTGNIDKFEFGHTFANSSQVWHVTFTPTQTLQPSDFPEILHLQLFDAVLQNGNCDITFTSPAAPIPPTVNPISNATINEGSTYTVDGSFTDPDSASWTSTVDYGDGTGSQPLTITGTNFSLNHVYKNNGTYTVMVSVTDNQGATGTGTTTVTVNNVSPTVGIITAPSSTGINTTFTASANFTDPGRLDTHTASWNWGDGNITNATVTEASGSGSISDTHIYTTAGSYPITLTVTDTNNDTGQNTTTVTAVNQITTLSPAKVWIGLKNSNDVGIKFDVLAEVYKDTTMITSGELDSVAAGSSGFTNAKLDTISFDPFSPIDFPSGSQLKMKVSVRNACTGSGHNSGTARLWFNDSSANSQFGATIGTNTSNYFLVDNFLLNTSAGTGSKKTIDVSAGAKCSAFKPFGSWSITP